MTIRTFWTIFLKILGIWLLLSSLTVIPSFLYPIFYASTIEMDSSTLSIIPLLLILIIYFLTFFLLIFQTTWLIDKLRLDKGFIEDKLDFSIQASTLLAIATIVIGGIIVVDALPQLCRQLFLFLQQSQLFIEGKSSGWIIFDLVKTIIGIFLMTNSKLVVQFINKQTGNKNVDDE